MWEGLPVLTAVLQIPRKSPLLKPMSKKKAVVTDAITEARNKCTIPQQRFCEEYVRGKPASTAYRDAGYRCKTDKVAYSSSSALLRVSKVKAYINALREQDTADSIMSRHDTLSMMSRIARREEKKAPNIAIRAASEKNRMTGEYRPESVTVDGNMTLFEQITGKRRKSQ